MQRVIASRLHPWSQSRPALLVDEVGRGSNLERMRSVGIKALNNRLSEYVRLAASGWSTSRRRSTGSSTPSRTAPTALRSRNGYTSLKPGRKS